MNTNIKNYEDLKQFLGDAILNNTLFNILNVDCGNVENFTDFTHICDNCDCDCDDFYCENCESSEMSYKDIFQYYIISKDSAEYLKANTREVVYKCYNTDTYFWGVDHMGTSWENVPFNNWLEKHEGVV